jgi:hypothetical protein
VLRDEGVKKLGEQGRQGKMNFQKLCDRKLMNFIVAKIVLRFTGKVHIMNVYNNLLIKLLT